MEDRKDLYISLDDAVFDAIGQSKQHELSIALDKDKNYDI